MNAPQSFSAFLVAGGHVPTGVDLPPAAGVVGVLTSLREQMEGPQVAAAFELLGRVHQLADNYSRECGVPRVVSVRASPVGDVDRRVLAGIVGDALC